MASSPAASERTQGVSDQAEATEANSWRGGSDTTAKGCVSSHEAVLSRHDPTDALSPLKAIGLVRGGSTRP